MKKTTETEAEHKTCVKEVNATPTSGFKPSPIMVTYDITTETEAERKARIKAGKPAATFSFTVEGYRNG